MHFQQLGYYRALLDGKPFVSRKRKAEFDFCTPGEVSAAVIKMPRSRPKRAVRKPKRFVGVPDDKLNDAEGYGEACGSPASCGEAAAGSCSSDNDDDSSSKSGSDSSDSSSGRDSDCVESLPDHVSGPDVDSDDLMTEGLAPPEGNPPAPPGGDPPAGLPTDLEEMVPNSGMWKDFRFTRAYTRGALEVTGWQAKCYPEKQGSRGTSVPTYPESCWRGRYALSAQVDVVVLARVGGHQ